jgi:hypothetical protein
MKRSLSLALLLCVITLPAMGQAPAPQSQLQAQSTKPPRAVAKQDPFAVTNWFEIPSDSNLARSADLRGRKVDLIAKEDGNNINVYGRKQKFEPRNWFRSDLDEPWVSAAAPSVDMPVQQRSSCEGAAYDTVGGQPGTGRDMIGALGAGSGC